MLEKISIEGLQSGRYLDVCPGRGSLLVPIKNKVNFPEDINAIQSGVEEALPLYTAHGRRSYFISVKAKQLVYGTIRQEVKKLVEAYNGHTGSNEYMPIINSAFLERWFKKMGIDKEHTLSMLGVALRGDSIVCGRTRKGGAYIFIDTCEEGLTTSLRRYWGDVLRGKVSGERLFEWIVDVGIMTGFAKMNRMLIYYQITQQMGWKRVLLDNEKLTTITSGINADTWQAFYDCLCPTKGSILAMRSKDSILICLDDLTVKNEVYANITMDISHPPEGRIWWTSGEKFIPYV